MNFIVKNRLSLITTSLFHWIANTAITQYIFQKYDPLKYIKNQGQSFSPLPNGTSANSTIILPRQVDSLSYKNIFPKDISRIEQRKIVADFLKEIFIVWNNENHPELAEVKWIRES